MPGELIIPLITSHHDISMYDMYNSNNNTNSNNNNRNMSSTANDKKSISSNQSNDSEIRIQRLENETKELKQSVTKILSIITLQTEQLARQEKILNEFRDERYTKSNGRLTMCWIVLFVIMVLVMSIMYMGIPMIREDTMLHLTTIVTPVKAPFITTSVKVRFTMGDLMQCVRGAFAGNTLDLSLT